ncbi:flagellar biosynthesis protein FlhA [Leptospira ilyithenensis]|uniref:Flagellar type III secretion system protein FlhA n=1 Tax=Leptospira ilyithenensis TaxID=2484901 RepID=A0A4R9LK01_9LEPT|nr:flagellar biosynthesis protein FlhA [Leptospira ilyithenensis]TGN07173.1 flagellar type III secretion system protein FlhA [Leptospira ilyithenensis]
MNYLRDMLKQSDLILGIGTLVILGMLIVPLPGFILDVLLVISIGLGLLILLNALSVTEPSEFSIFPSLLLITTLFRLALNVSTTRAILSKGPAMNSSVIEAFGTFVVGSESGLGKYVVGLIIFIILTIVQVLVITKGATRISEVAARFTLDGLPQKQMSIDMELNSGSITEQEAKIKRKKVQREVDFYGAMDGASKFVQGDVRAGLIITAINLVGGIVIGSTIRGESFLTAIETYGKFTIGDGLVSQIPGLLSTTATGIIVTRSSSEKKLTLEVKDQLFGNSKTLYVVAGALGLASLIPGLPFFSLIILSAGIGYLGYSIEQVAKEEIKKIETVAQEKVQERKPENYIKEISVEAIQVELGRDLLPLVDASSGGHLLEQIANTRKKFATDFGLVIPAIRIVDNLEIPHDNYTIRINGVVVGQSVVKADRLMAMNSSQRELEPISGESFVEPAFSMKATWIDPQTRPEVENKGYSVVDPSTVIITHLKELISTYASQLLGREEVKALLEHLRQTHPTLVQELDYDKQGRLGVIQQTLQNLLVEGLSIKNLPKIMEAIANNITKSLDPFFLSESVRQAISRQIVNDFLAVDGKLHVVTIDPRIVDRLNRSLMQDEVEGKIIILPHEVRTRIMESLYAEFQKALEENRFLIFVIARYLRQPFAFFLAKEIPPRNFAVLASEEIQRSVPTEIASVLSLVSKEEHNQEA